MQLLGSPTAGRFNDKSTVSWATMGSRKPFIDTWVGLALDHYGIKDSAVSTDSEITADSGTPVIWIFQMPHSAWQGHLMADHLR